MGFVQWDLLNMSTKFFKNLPAFIPLVHTPPLYVTQFVKNCALENNPYKSIKSKMLVNQPIELIFIVLKLRTIQQLSHSNDDNNGIDKNLLPTGYGGIMLVFSTITLAK